MDIDPCNNIKILNELVNLGYDRILVKNVLTYLSPNSVTNAIGYLTKENDQWLHPMISSNDANSICCICLEGKNFHKSPQVDVTLHLNSKKIHKMSSEFINKDRITNDYFTYGRKQDLRTFIDKRPHKIKIGRKENTFGEFAFRRKKISPDPQSRNVRKSRSITNFLMKLKSFESEDSSIGPQEFKILKSPNPRSYTFAYASVNASPKRRDSKDIPLCNECRYSKDTIKLKCDHHSCLSCITNIIKRGVNSSDIGQLMCRECMKLYSKEFVISHLNDPRLKIAFIKLYYNYRQSYDDITELIKCPFCTGHALKDHLYTSCCLNESTTNQLDKSGDFIIIPKKMNESKLYLMCENGHQFCHLCQEVDHEQGFCPYEEPFPQPEIKCVCGCIIKKVSILTNEFECSVCKRKICFICRGNDISPKFHYYNPYSTCLLMKYISKDSVYVISGPIKLIRHVLIIALMIILSPVISLFTPFLLVKMFEFCSNISLIEVIMKKNFLKKKERGFYRFYHFFINAFMVITLVYMVPLDLVLSVIVIMNLILSLFFNLFRTLFMKLNSS